MGRRDKNLKMMLDYASTPPLSSVRATQLSRILRFIPDSRLLCCCPDTDPGEAAIPAPGNHAPEIMHSLRAGGRHADEKTQNKGMEDEAATLAKDKDAAEQNFSKLATEYECGFPPSYAPTHSISSSPPLPPSPGPLFTVSLHPSLYLPFSWSAAQHGHVEELQSDTRFHPSASSLPSCPPCSACRC